MISYIEERLADQKEQQEKNITTTSSISPSACFTTASPSAPALDASLRSSSSTALLPPSLPSQEGRNINSPRSTSQVAPAPPDPPSQHPLSLSPGRPKAALVTRWRRGGVSLSPAMSTPLAAWIELVSVLFFNDDNGDEAVTSARSHSYLIHMLASLST